MTDKQEEQRPKYYHPEIDNKTWAFRSDAAHRAMGQRAKDDLDKRVSVDPSTTTNEQAAWRGHYIRMRELEAYERRGGHQ